MLTLRTLRVVALALFVAAGHARAATLYTTAQTFDTGLKPTTGNFTNFSFAKFDSSLGTLTDVLIRLDGYAQAGYMFSDLSGDTNLFQLTGDVTVMLDNPAYAGTPLAVATPSFSDIPRSVAAFGTYTSPGYPSVRTLSGTNTTGTIDYASDEILALFEGPGDVSLRMAGAIAWNFAAAGDAQAGISSRYIGTATVSYGYAQIPEASTSALLLGGFALTAAAVWRRRRS